MSLPSCRHGRRENDFYFTYFEVMLVSITFLDIVVILYLWNRCRADKSEYDSLSKKVDETIEDLKSLQDTTQIIVPLMYLRKMKRNQEELISDDALKHLNICETHATPTTTPLLAGATTPSFELVNVPTKT